VGVSHSLLLIDDDEDILGGLESYFCGRGYAVDCATEKEEAEALLGHVAYSCAIVDIHLTGLGAPDGLEVIRTARELSPSTRLVVLSANGSPAVRAAALELGADAYLQKPLPLPELESIVSGLLGGRANNDLP
jgi:two-component system OmpR family response regulator